VPPRERNALRVAVIGGTLQVSFQDPVAAARFQVAHFRADTTDRIGDPALESLVLELQQESRLFAHLWSLHEVNKPSHSEIRYVKADGQTKCYDFVSVRAGDGGPERLHTMIPRS
jgi:hypothetical protein